MWLLSHNPSPRIDWKFAPFKGGSIPRNAMEHLILRQNTFLHPYNTNVCVDNIQYVDNSMNLTDPNRELYQMNIRQTCMTKTFIDKDSVGAKFLTLPFKSHGYYTTKCWLHTMWIEISNLLIQIHVNHTATLLFLQDNDDYITSQTMQLQHFSPRAL